MSRHKGGAEQWGGKVARWAGIGNNRGRSGDQMAEETMVQGTEEKELALETEEAQEAREAAQAAAEDPSEALKTELEQVKGERDQLLDRLARLQAEFENSRRRETKERQDVRDYAVQNAVEPFLGVIDNFKLALSSQGSVEQLRAGVELIVRQMDEALKGLNVQPVETVGTQFDPRVHEALGSIETAEYPDHQVIEEIRKGYKLRDKLLRPALVKIAVNSKQVSE
ncbi:MAG TPA: nucleotide exchange factor GrpE [Acidobacteriaceae bacterium]|nr:nucleotide exchange factor GrpE [Acidobacteriaceae bacterium]